MSNYSKGKVQQQQQQQQHKCCDEWKTRYRLLPPSKQDRKQSRIRAVSTVCAQISGQQLSYNSTSTSGVDRNRISRENLVQQVVQAIGAEEEVVASLMLRRNNNNNGDVDVDVDDTSILPLNDYTVSVAAIEAHTPSGQIRCTIQVKQHQQQQQQQQPKNTDTNFDNENENENNDTEMNDFSSRQNDKNNDNGSSSSKLAQWYEKTTGKRLPQLENEPSSQHQHSNCNTNITIETIPAHQSALNPDVHRLYAHYQHVVHDDTDPFSVSDEHDPNTNTNTMNTNNVNMNMNTNTNTNTNNNRNEVDEDDEEDEQEPKLDTDDPSELDWGNAPTYFTENIQSMLTNYIQQQPVTVCQSVQYSQSSEEYEYRYRRRRAVLSNYYSFYQFLVEAPFPLSDDVSCSNSNRNNDNPPNNRNSNSTQQQQQQQQKSKTTSWNKQDDCSSSSSSSPHPHPHNFPCGLYHQHYRLGENGFLIAVGVIDILPNGLSSVYLFYHPSFSYELAALGKYAILKEVEFARDTLNVPYYYLGY